MCLKAVYLALCFLSFLQSFCTSTDTITFNQSLKDDGDVIISTGKTFALGFFTPGNSRRRYVGIWYNVAVVSEQTAVWVANRNNPINGTSGVLSLDDTGNLVLRDERSNVSVWTTGVSFPAKTTVKKHSAQLLDTGNLVLLFEENKDTRVIAWQSFHHPTNTILPYMKFGLDNKGLNWVLKSWKAPDDPGDGQYLYKMETKGIPQEFMYRGSGKIWRAGPWNGFGWSGVPQMKAQFIFNLSYVENNVITQTYAIDDGPSVLSRIVLNETGKMEGLTWNIGEKKWEGFWFAPKDQCDDYRHCGVFSSCNPYEAAEVFECTCLPGFEPRDARAWEARDGFRGCGRKKGENVCRNGEGFAKLTRMKIPDTEMARVNMTMELEECEEACLRNCSCTGYASANVSAGGIGCITWHDELIDMKEFANGGGQDMYIRISASELAKLSDQSDQHIHERTLVAIAVVSLIAISLALYSAYYLVVRMKKKRDKIGGGQRNMMLSLNNSLESYQSSSMAEEMDEGGPSDVLIFDLDTIISATANFSLANELGEGGFGHVYKGRLSNGQEIAVKRLSRNSDQGDEEFKNEVTLIAKLQHRNLVKLFGCCIQQGEKMLVYEYLPNKGLDTFIFGTRGSILDWKKRFEIILGIARGLLYLHQDSRLRIIHRDLKASNVLLDACMRPKISDFGMARIFGGDQIEASTNRVVGTYGYMSPEYAMEGYFSMKSDVYSFGVLLLEIITGRKNSQYHESTMNLVGYVWDFWREEKALEVIDPLVADSYEAQEVLRCIHIGLLCVQAHQNDRPAMSDVVFMLCNETTTLYSPNPPGFIGRQSGNYAAHSTAVNPSTNTAADISCVSVNDTSSITIVEGHHHLQPNAQRWGFINPDNQSFVLGFFSLDNNSSGNRYVGIWFQKIPVQTVVWVANRDNPVKGKSGILIIDTTGNLVIQDNKTNVSVWNTSLSDMVTGIKSYSVLLQDSGNLVLYHDPDRRVIKWQSFDYPTNTLLPFMKFGVDKKTGLNRRLTSWKSPQDPGTGEYEFKMELNGTPQVFLEKGSGRVWRTGPWSGLGWSGVPEMTRNYIFNLDYAENEDEVTMTYWIRDPSIHSIFVLNESGTVNRLTWQGDDVEKWVGFWSAPKDQCDEYDHCGAFSNCNTFNPGAFECTCLPGFGPNSTREWYLRDGVHGCRRNNTNVCHDGEGFMLLSRVKVPDTKTARVNRTIGLKECEELCLEDCSCTGYASANINAGGLGCVTWYGELIDMKEFTKGGQDMYIRVSASDLAQLVKKSKGLRGERLIFAVVVPIAAVILVLCFCLILKMRKGKSLQSAMEKDMEESAPADVLMYDLNTIRAATDNFSAANKLGEGGFGSVYKGKLQNGDLVAIKRLSKTSGQGIEEFKNEVTLIARLQHRNLVRLLGCCVQQGEKMLVYEYLPNKSLDSFIFENTSGISLDWRKRFEIILGIARGLLYLHQDSRLKIIHRDLKASNVLLDASMQPKISDFGMARIFGGDQIYANTNRVVGTYGYMSPEYAMEGHFSVKSDVFSFGVMLLEIVSGRKNKNQFNENSLNLIGDVWDFWSETRVLELVDPSLGESYEEEEVVRCIHVGLLCVQAFPNDRPTMSEVVFMLSNETKLPNPNPPGFIFKQGSTAQCSSSMSAGNQSVNEMSITKVEGR